MTECLDAAQLRGARLDRTATTSNGKNTNPAKSESLPVNHPGQHAFDQVHGLECEPGPKGLLCAFTLPLMVS